MVGVAGTRCRLTVDFHGDDELPVEGDFLRSAAGACYLIETIRASKTAPRRLRCGVIRIGRDAVEPGAEGVWTFVWNSRHRRRSPPRS